MGKVLQALIKNLTSIDIYSIKETQLLCRLLTDHIELQQASPLGSVKLFLINVYGEFKKLFSKMISSKHLSGYAGNARWLRRSCGSSQEFS